MKSKYPGARFAIGLAIGIAIGVALDNLAVGMGIGAALGFVYGSSAFDKKDEENDKNGGK